MTSREADYTNPSLLGVVDARLFDESDIAEASFDGFGLAEYINLTIRGFANSHEPLYRYIFEEIVDSEVKDIVSFGMGFAITYNSLGEEVKSDPLGEDDVTVFKQSLNEHVKKDEEGREYFDFEWCFSKLAEYEPSLYSLLLDTHSDYEAFEDSEEDTGSEHMEELGEEELDLQDFGLAIILTAMPFVLRAEAKLIDKELNPDSSKG